MKEEFDGRVGRIHDEKEAGYKYSPQENHPTRAEQMRVPDKGGNQSESKFMQWQKKWIESRAKGLYASGVSGDVI
jgi:hypothetical protein